MQRSFLLVSRNSEELLVEQLHINMWFFSENRIFVDVGLLITVQTDRVITVLDEIVLYTPFYAKEGSATCLCDILQNNQVMQVVFNDEVESRLQVSHSPNQGSFIEFRSGRKFLLLKTAIQQSDYALRLTPQTIGLRVNELQIISGKNTQINVYMRVRFEVDIKGTSNILFLRDFFRTQITYDFRFNERRLFGESDPSIYVQTIGVKHIYIFIIQPHSYKIALNPTKMRYIRLLERVSGWEQYIPPLKNDPSIFLVYSWKNEYTDRPDRSFTMLVSYEVNLDVVERLNIILVIAILSFLFTVLPQIIAFSDEIALPIPIIVSALYFIATVFWILLIAMVISLLRDLIKYYYQRIKVRK